MYCWNITRRIAWIRYGILGLGWRSLLLPILRPRFLSSSISRTWSRSSVSGTRSAVSVSSRRWWPIILSSSSNMRGIIWIGAGASRALAPTFRFHCLLQISYIIQIVLYYMYYIYMSTKIKWLSTEIAICTRPVLQYIILKASLTHLDAYVTFEIIWRWQNISSICLLLNIISLFHYLSR